MGVASITPALPKISVDLNLSKLQVSLLISVFTFPGIFLTPVAGILADRYGRKTVLIPSLFLFAMAGFTIFYTRDFQMILILRIIQGIGAASIGSLNTTLIGDFYKGKDRPKAMGYNASVLSLATTLYPLFGGALAGIAWFYPFLMPLLAIPVGLFVLFKLEEPPIQKNPSFKQYLKAVSQSILKKEVLAIFGLSILTFVILYGAFLTYVPFLLHQEFELSAPQIGIFLSVSSLATAFLATQVGKLTQKYGSVKLLKMAFFLYFFVSLAMPNTQDMYVFILPILLFGAAQALNIPSLQTILANLAPDEQRGAFMSLNGMVLRIGQTIGPLIIGVGYSLADTHGAFYLSAVIAMLGLVLIFTALRKEV